MRIVFDQKIETWLRLHIEAFTELGGVVATVVPDNLKAAVIRAAFGVDGAASLNPSYCELARHYQFKIDPAPIYAPKKKGKVESAVKYVKRNFFVGRDNSDADDTKRDLARWVDEIANTRIHGTTHRRPIELFAEEREALKPLPPVVGSRPRSGTRLWSTRTRTWASIAGSTRCRGRLSARSSGCVPRRRPSRSTTASTRSSRRILVVDARFAARSTRTFPRIAIALDRTDHTDLLPARGPPAAARRTSRITEIARSRLTRREPRRSLASAAASSR